MENLNVLQIGGLIKHSTIDFPQKLAAVIFTKGCNFTCPFCHNPHLLGSAASSKEAEGPLAQNSLLPPEEILAFLTKRRKVLDGVVISGGEPTLQKSLPHFISELKHLGYAIKLDTNGSSPQMLAQLLQGKLIDYVALDLKSDPHKYPPELSPKFLGDSIIQSVFLLKESNLPHEFRTTVAFPFVTKESILAIAKTAAGNSPLFLQKYRPQSVLNPSFMAQFKQATETELLNYQALCQPYLPTEIR